MNPAFELPARAPRCAAFTLTDLLVLLAIVAVLIAVQVPALGRGKALSRREQCAGNLRQFGFATQLLANENNSRLPDPTVGFWPWDLGVTTVDSLVRYGATRSSLYCPANPDQNTDGLWNFAFPNYRVIGYVTSFTAGLINSNLNSSISPQMIFLGALTYPPPLPSKRVLLADVTVSAIGQNNPALVNTYQYSGIPGGFALPGWPGHRTSHLAGAIPEGGNLAMLDGHVEWRQFSAMLPRTGVSGPPTFWW